MRALGALIFVLVLLASSAGCAGIGGSDDGEPTASGTTETTPSAIRTLVYERAYSECATYPMLRLATKYGVDRKVDPVARAVARFWTRQFKAEKDAIPVGTRACIQGFNDPVGNPA